MNPTPANGLHPAAERSGAAMAQQIEQFPWQRTPLGPQPEWPQSLRTAVSICLHSRFPTQLWWGSGLTLLYNDAFVPLLGSHGRDALGKPAEAVWNERWPALVDAAASVRERGDATRPERTMCWIERNGQPTPAWFTWSLSPLCDDAGGFAGMLWTGVEDSASVPTESGQRGVAEQRQLALDAARMGSFEFDPDSGLLQWDRRFETMFGLDALGGPVSMVMQRVHPADRSRVEEMLQDALDPASSQPYMTEYRIRLEDGSERWIAAHGIAAAADASSGRQIPYLVGTVSDITERKRVEHALMDARQRLQLAQQAGGIGTYELDPASGFATGSPLFYRHFGLPADTARFSFGDWRRRIHPDDRDQLFTRLEELFEHSGTAGASGEYRVMLPDNRVRWLEYSAIIERDESGAAHRVIGTVMDVTGRHDVETSLRQSRERLQLALEASGLGDWRWDAGSRSVELSDRARAMLGLSGTTGPVGCRRLVELLAPADVDRVQSAIRRAIDERSGFSVECTVERLDGSSIWAGLIGRSTLGPDGQLSRLIGVIEDATCRRQQQLMLERAAQRQAFLVELSDRLHPLAQPAEVMTTLCRMTAVQLGATRCHFAEIIDDGSAMVVAGEHAEQPPVTLGTHALDRFGREFAHRLQTGVVTAIDDVTADPLTCDAVDEWSSIGSRAVLVAPLRRSGRLMSLLAVHHDDPHHWTEDERSLVQEVADRGWAIVKQARVECAVRDLLAAEQRARARAEQQSRLKDEFLATLSHELRTPLNAILGWAQLLVLGRLSPEQTSEGIRAIERNARAQADLVDDLLDMSRIIAGGLKLEPRDTDVGEIVNAAIGTVRTAVDAKDIELTTRIPPDIDRNARVDPARIQQVIWNLLSNAVKFTPAGGHIHVALESTEAVLRIVVRDDGEGIRPDFMPHVFGRFRQADPSTTRRHGGLGIGLSLVRELVELHGGTVRAESAGEGQGATFTVELPRHSHPRRVEQSSTVARHDAAAPSPASEPDAELDGIRVLLVEDDRDTRELLATLLKGAHADVVSAGSAQDGLDAMRAARPAVVVSDIAMPDCDGYEFIRRVRSQPAADGGNVPAIALTAFARAEDAERAIEAGYQMHLAKPVDPARLVRLIGSLAGRPAA